MTFTSTGELKTYLDNRGLDASLQIPLDGNKNRPIYGENRRYVGFVNTCMLPFFLMVWFTPEYRENAGE